MKQLLVVTTFAALSLCALPSLADTLESQKGMLSMSGHASIEVPKDTMVVRLSAYQEGRVAAAVQEQLKQTINQALAVLKPHQAPVTFEVETTGFTVDPDYRENPKSGRNDIVGWRGRAGLQVSGTDMALVSRMAADLKGLLIEEVGYEVSKALRESTEKKAAREAIANFRERADDYRQSFGFKNYELVNVNVNAQTDGPPMMGYSPKAMRSTMAAESVPMAAGSGAVRVVVSGQIRLY